jgi:hypothetical protein
LLYFSNISSAEQKGVGPYGDQTRDLRVISTTL